MAIRFLTATPKKLLSTFKKAIDDNHIRTWTYASDGDFSHTPPQWKDAAWMRPTVVGGKKLVFNIISPDDTSVSTAAYAAYHSHLLESMLNHCSELFTDARTTATPDSAAGDLV